VSCGVEGESLEQKQGRCDVTEIRDEGFSLEKSLTGVVASHYSNPASALVLVADPTVVGKDEGGLVNGLIGYSLGHVREGSLDRADLGPVGAALLDEVVLDLGEAVAVELGRGGVVVDAGDLAFAVAEAAIAGDLLTSEGQFVAQIALM
jgi:hypothetical protein